MIVSPICEMLGIKYPIFQSTVRMKEVDPF